MGTSSEQQGIKQCAYCRRWLLATDFLYDPSLRPIGMVVSEDSTEVAYYVFQHDLDDCGSSLLIPVESLRSYILEKDIPAHKLTLSAQCKCHCVNVADLSDCLQACTYAPYRRLLLWMLAIRGELLPQKSGERLP